MCAPTWKGWCSIIDILGGRIDTTDTAPGEAVQQIILYLEKEGYIGLPE